MHPSNASVLAVLVFVGCGRTAAAPELLAPEPTAASAPARVSAAPASTAATVPGLNPNTVREAVLASRTWSQVTLTALQKNSLCAPGARSPASGSHPDHMGELFHLYLERDQEAYQNGKPMPNGTVVVKRSFKGNVESGTTAYFLMFKRADQGHSGAGKLGAGQAGSDWLYATTDPEGRVIRSGALADCAGCHDKQRESDYLFRKY